ncbi:hypothetical protein Ddye_026820 [Dipteronia dyeriana]|uniref:TOD1/MUCI70 glycosyltransferase-like domain-containing protein n=1 Tax=Dipteronia dyeriana TaxID=168575 RepID=A0AAD9TNY5_9ROSI|nr:hypothetical protein Ddye_026820 [Dipteronia dyeriana]
MTGGSLAPRTGSYGSLQLPGIFNNNNNNINFNYNGKPIARKTSAKMLFSGPREKDRFLPFVCCLFLGRRKVAMLLLCVLALLVFTLGSLTVNKENTTPNVNQRMGNIDPYGKQVASNPTLVTPGVPYGKQVASNPALVTPGVDNMPKYRNSSMQNDKRKSNKNKVQHPLSPHPCESFAFPPPPPPGFRRPGPRPCPVCYLPVEQAIASMPSSPSASPVLQNLTYVLDENPVNTESHGGSDFGGYPSLKQRKDSYDIKESMTVHCGFVKGSTPGRRTGFDIDESDLKQLDQFHEVIVASAIFGNYDVVQQPQNISAAATKNIPFYMFIDEETEAYMKNSSVLDSNKRIGLWRIIVVHNIPYSDARRNGKIPKLLLHRIFPNVRYSIWIDGKLKLVVDPYQILERFLWRQNANFAISRHYKRFDVFVEAEANKAAGKYDNSSIDNQIEFYKSEGLTPYSETKLPITSDVPEGCVIVREHIPITNLFTCLWFNEVDRFTARDQLSFSTVRDKIMAKVSWSVNMFLDCERRNFVIQAYHRDLLEHMAPPPPRVARTQYPRVPPDTNVGNSRKKSPARRGKGDKKSGSKRHRKIVAGNKDNNISF